MKRVAPQEAWKRKYPEQVAFAVTCDPSGRPNIISLGWAMPTSMKPPMAAISIGHTRYSHNLLEKVPEFVLAFPTESMEEAVLLCGSTSGRDTDKFKEAGLTPAPAEKVRPPLIAECAANFECRVTGTLVTGDHTVFAGEIVAAYISDEPVRRLYNLGGAEFRGL